MFQKKKRSAFFRISAAIAALALLIALISPSAAICMLNAPAEVRLLTENDWAFYNYGQEIDGICGVKNVDIGLWLMRTPLANEKLLGSSEIVVGIVDTGVDPSSIPLNIQLSGGNIAGWDFYNGDKSIYDDYLYDYHGTYIATTIVRAAPKVTILPVKFMEGSHGGIYDAVSAIKYAIEGGARIINCSWNFDTYNDVLYDVIRSHPETLFVCAAGNTNINTDISEIYPCCYDLNNIISVMAINSRGEPYEASGYGSAVDIAAPGDGVRVLLPEGDFDYINGTSVATAFVSSAAALILSVDNSMTPEQVKDLIVSSATGTDALVGICAAGGYLNISACIASLKGGYILNVVN